MNSIQCKNKHVDAGKDQNCQVDRNQIWNRNLNDCWRYPWLPFHKYVTVLIVRSRSLGKYLDFRKRQVTCTSRAIVMMACVSNTPHTHHSFFVVGLYMWYIECLISEGVEESSWQFFYPYQLEDPFFSSSSFWLSPRMSHSAKWATWVHSLIGCCRPTNNNVKIYWLGWGKPLRHFSYAPEAMLGACFEVKRCYESCAQPSEHFV